MAQFTSLFKKLKNQAKRTLVLANGVDSHSLEAVKQALHLGLVEFIITGDEKTIHEQCKSLGIGNSGYTVVHAADTGKAVRAAVDIASSGKAGLIMKGFVNTDVFMRAVLDKQKGLLPVGSLLTHVSIVESAAYHKPLFISDVAIIPLPTFEQKVQMTKYLIDIARKTGVEKPKVAFIAATEKLIEKMPACADAARLTKMWEQGEFPDSFCHGPMAFDLAVDKHVVTIKNFNSSVAGDADCLLFPNIETGNVFYKTNTLWCKAHTAAMVVGTKVPTVLASRGDSVETKLNSIAFAAITSNNE